MARQVAVSTGLQRGTDRVPEEWRTVELSDVADVRRDGVDPREADSERYVGLEHIEPCVLRITRWGTPDDVRSSKFRFEPGNVLYAKLRPYLDKGALAEWEGICSTDIHVIRPSEQLEPYYLAACVHHPDFLAYATAAMTGVNHPRTSWDTLKRFRILLPPLGEQTRIATVLRAVQQAKEATGKVIAAARELKRSLMDYLFTRGPVPVEHANEIETAEILGFSFPSSWGWASLQDISRGGKQGVQGGPFGSRLTRKDYVESGVPVIRGNNLAGPGKFVSTGFAFVSHEKATQLARHKARPGDLIVTQRGSLGQVGIIPFNEFEEYVISQSQMKATIDQQKASSEFLFYFFQTPMALRQISNDIVKSGVPHINLASFRALKVPLPPMKEQDLISAILRAADRKIEAEEEHRTSLTVLFSALLSELMTGRRRIAPPEVV